MRQEHITSLSAILLLVGLAGSAFWYSQMPEDNDNLPQSKTVRQTPDYEVEQLRLTQMDAKGQASYYLQAKTLWHYPADDHYRFELPKLITATPNRPVTTITANRGRSSSQAIEIELEDNVVIHRDDGEAPPLKITTDYLKAYPDDERAQTNRPVKVAQGESTLTGIGMDVDNVKRIINVHQQTQGIWFAPPKTDND